MRRAAKTALGALLLAGAYAGLLRRRILDWGATRDEAAARLPGDELLEQPDGVSTRAIDVAAPPSAVWPWLAQLGPAPRGGAYTYDWIENLLGPDMHSVDRVLPEEQPTIDFAYASVVTTHPVRAGERFTRDNLWVKRPGTGEILAARYEEVLGHIATRDIAANALLAWSDVGG